MTDKLMMGTIAVLFFMIVIGFTFMAYCCGIWLKNRREDRAGQVRRASREMSSRYSKCWTEWATLLDERDEEIENLKGQISVLTQSLDRTKQILATSEGLRGVKA